MDPGIMDGWDDEKDSQKRTKRSKKTPCSSKNISPHFFNIKRKRKMKVLHVVGSGSIGVCC
jgi:hypothetical protein